MPAGYLREPTTALARADLLVLVDRGDGSPDPPATGPPAERVVRARLACAGRQPLEVGTPVHALSGIADPVSFERSLVELGLRLTGATRHADHHPFTTADVRAAAGRAAAEGADFLAVTAKDRTRWPRDPGGHLPAPAVFDLDVEMEEEDRFLEAVEARLDEEGS